MSDVSKKVVLVLIIIYIISLIIQTASIAIVTGRVSEGIVSLNILVPVIWVRAPFNLTATVNPDGVSIDLNWSNISEADSYTVYYSSNLTELKQINLSNLSAGITSVAGITNINWTDWDAGETNKRYYTVSSVRGSTKNVSKEIVGKHSLRYIANAAGTLGYNMISLPLNASYDAESFLQEIPANLNPTITKLDRSDPEVENWVSHFRDTAANIFDLTTGAGYLVNVRANYTHTITGPAYVTLVSLRYISSSDGTLGYNMIGIPYSSHPYDAESFLQEIPANLNPTITKLDRSDPEVENWVPHFRDTAANIFNLTVGEGYLINVRGNYTHSLT